MTATPLPPTGTATPAPVAPEPTRASAPWLERHQASVCAASIAVGACVGLLAPAAAPAIGLAVEPVLALLLFATFVTVPFGAIGRALRDWRFLVAALGVNLVLAPLLAFLGGRVIDGMTGDRGILIAVVIVLCAPCVDYVVTFTGLAGGARDRVLAAVPVLLVVQALVVPIFLRMFVGDQAVALFEIGPLVRAVAVVLVTPLGLAIIVQVLAARLRPVAAVRDATLTATVPLLGLTLALVVASNIAAVGARIEALFPALAVYLIFAGVMATASSRIAGLARLDEPGRVALVFTGVTRNSLVVLPIALALPAGFELAPLAIVLQTLVELCVLVVLVRTGGVVPFGGRRAVPRERRKRRMRGTPGGNQRRSRIRRR